MLDFVVSFVVYLSCFIALSLHLVIILFYFIRFQSLDMLKQQVPHLRVREVLVVLLDWRGQHGQQWFCLTGLTVNNVFFEGTPGKLYKD